MPLDKSRYPLTWDAISLRVRAEAGQRCAFCGAPNGQYIWRDQHHNPHVVDLNTPDPALPEWIEVSKLTRIVLTVAHLGTMHPDGTPGDPHDKHDVREENLAALCQSCHLVFDRKDHMRHAAENRFRKKLKNQPTLF